MQSVFDVAVVGAGIIGRAIAFELARRRLRVLLIDAGNRGATASEAAAGLLPVASIRAMEGPRFTAAVAALRLYPEFLHDLEAHGGGEHGLEHPGSIRLATSEGGAENLRRHIAWRRAQGYAADYVDGTRVASHLAGIADRFAGAAVYPNEAQVDAIALLAALKASGARLGVVTREGTAALRRVGESGAEVTVDHRAIAARTIVVAAGWWSRDLCRGIDLDLPIEGERGDGLELALPGPVPPHAIDHHCVILPRTGALVWVVGHGRGADDVGAGAEELRRRAALVWPSVAAAEVRRAWWGTRPFSRLHHPMVSRAPGFDNLIIAAGHHRSGFLHAPLTSRIVAAQILGEVPPAPAGLFGWQASDAGEEPED